MKLFSQILLSILFLIFYSSTKAQINLSQGLVAHYPFTGNANDVSGNNNNGVVNGAVLCPGLSGLPNTAYLFDGISNYIQVSNNSLLNSFPGDSFTLCALVKTKGFYNGACHGNCIIEKGNSDFIPGHYSLRFSDTYSSSFQNCNSPVNVNQQNYNLQVYGSSTTSSYQYPLPYIDTSQWDCIVATCDGDSTRIYVNAQLRQSIAMTGSLLSNNDDLFLGRKNSFSFPYWFHGIMDDIRIYNRVLNMQEIYSLCDLNSSVTNNIINHYASVNDFIPCSNTIVVDSSNNFFVGDTVLIIQMKGSIVDSTNTPTFGDVININSCGNYEINFVQNVVGNNITLLNNLERNYDFINGVVQLVRIPSFQNYTISSSQTALKWNGSKGGVYALIVLDTLVINDTISVSGKGFNGGVSNVINSTIGTCNQFQYFDPPNINNSASKGEGISNISLNKSYARGKLANAGGGGNGHNGGGGGGANFGGGGLGGSQFHGCNNIALPNTTGGVGGCFLQYNNIDNKIFLGGGGGAGHSNNYLSTYPPQNLYTSDGAPGGGIAIIIADKILSNGGSINADGRSGLSCFNNSTYGVCHDGMGGGGAGGTILVQTSSVVGSLNISCKGGRGGDVSSDASLFPLGPGGGGGGGIFWTNLTTIPANVVLNFNGGPNGVCQNSSNNSWGANAGSNGSSLLNLTIPKDTILFTNNNNFASTGPNQIICAGDTAQLLASGGISYSWSNSSTLSNSNVPNPLSFPNGTTQYIVTVTDSLGCIDTASQIIVVNQLPTLNTSTSPSSLCFGQSTIITASGATQLSWNPSIQNGVPFIPVATTTYTVVGTSSNGCSSTSSVTVVVNPNPIVYALASPMNVCAGSPCSLTGSGALNYSWSGGVNNGIPFFPSSAGSYTVVGTDANGCSATSSVSITVSAPPVISTTAQPDSICVGGLTQLNASGAATYQWSGGIQNNVPFSPSSSSTYTVSGIDNNGCTATATQAVYVYPSPVVSASAMPDSLCYGNQTVLFGSGASLYTWSGGIQNGVPFIPQTSGSYTVTGIDGNGCTASSSVYVNVFNHLPVGIINNQTTLCSGDSALLVGTGASSYSWLPASALDTTAGVSVWAYPVGGVTTFTVTGTDATGCTGTATTLLTTIPRINVVASKSNDIICGLQSAQLQAYGADNYLWSPAIGLSDPAIPNPVATIYQTTTYVVTGTSETCTDKDSVTITYFTGKHEFDLVPSAFSPNNDGLNDCLHVLHNVDLREFYFAIYNRWGQRVFETKNVNDCWDGNFNNEPAAVGTYYYFLRSNSPCGDNFVKGDVTLIR